MKTLPCLIVSALILILLNTPVYANDDVVGNAVAVIGTVTVVRSSSGAEEALLPNGELYLDDIVVTGADGLIKLLLRDESILKISPNSEVAISSMIAGPGAEGASTVDLLKGRLRSVIGNKLGANTEFNVNTPVAVAGVRGTDWEIAVFEINGILTVGARSFDGTVVFQSLGSPNGISVVLNANQFSRVTPGADPSEPVFVDNETSITVLLGVEEDQNSEVEGDEGNTLDVDLDLDEEQLRGLIDETDLDVLVEQIVEHLITEDVIVRTDTPVEEITDTQLEVIQENLNQGSTVNFEINIPLPN